MYFWKDTSDIVLTVPTKPPRQSPIYQKAIGILIWLAFAAAGVAALYALSKLAGD
jgi:hypothetical protein